VLDDLVGVYADVCIAHAQESLGEDGDVPTVAVSEAALHRTWDVYTETIRLAQGVRRARLSMEREPDTAGNLRAVVDSHRPWCLVATACALHLEYRRLLAAKGGRRTEAAEVVALPTNGEPLTEIDPKVFTEIAESLEACNARWPVESKMAKLMSRRVEEYRGGGPLMRSQSSSRRLPAAAAAAGPAPPSRPSDTMETCDVAGDD
jgi:hypothetical protein